MSSPSHTSPSNSSHVYIQEYVLCASPDSVWQLLSSPGMYGRWCGTVTIRHHTKHPGTLTSGSSWQESHHGALFLRSWVNATVTQHSTDQRSMVLLLDDGFNHIQQQLKVVGDSPGVCRIVTSLSCFQRRAENSPPVPSEKLALMWKKADKRLASLAGYIQGSAAAAAAGAAVEAPAVQHTPLVPV